MRRLITCLALYFTLFVFGFVMDLLGIQPTAYEILAFLGLIVVWVIITLKCFKRLSKFEKEVFIIVVLQTLALSWLWRDLKDGEVTLFTVLAVVCAIGAILDFLRRYKVWTLQR